MELQSILDIILGQGIWCVLFVYFYINATKTNAEREAKLMEQLDKSGDREEMYCSIIKQHTEVIIPKLEAIEKEIIDMKK